MSHTIGQVKQDNRQSNSNSSQANEDKQLEQASSSNGEVISDSPKPEDNTAKLSPPLKDADYEFLFNQLLEGISHGWHEPRIAKFFKQLGDRGQQQDWIAWLERLRTKVLTLPIQSKRQLGTMMIRLGELTQSAPEVDQIGAASHRIGRELLFGNDQDVVWEYAGPDLTTDSSTLEAEAEDNLSSRLPTDFSSLGSSGIEEIESNLTLESKEEDQAIELPEELTAISPPSNSSTEDATIVEESTLEEESDLTEQSMFGKNLQTTPTDFDLSEENKSTEISEDVSRASSLPNSAAESSTDEEQIGVYSEEFEFELASQESEPINEISADLSDSPATELDGESDHQKRAESWADEEFDSLLSLIEEQPLDLVEPVDSSASANNLSSLPESESETDENEVLETQDQDPVAIDIQQVMNLIQEDEELAQQISEKLNVSLVKLDNITTQTLEKSTKNLTSDLDQSSLELIESWFNLGLKQVSAGEFEKAIASWDKALKINPNLSEAWHNRGSALGRLGKYEGAIDSFQSALAIDPQNFQAWNDRAHALYQLQKWKEAVTSWNNAIQIMPGNHLFWYNRGCALEQLENCNQAVSSYEKSLEIKPDFQPARSRYINLIADNSRSN